MKKIKYIAAVSVLGAFPFIALAQNAITTFTLQNVTNILTYIRDWLFGILLILGIIIMLYAAFLYMTAGGDEEKVGSAKKALLYGLIGVGVALLSYAAFSFVTSIIAH